MTKSIAQALFSYIHSTFLEVIANKRQALQRARKSNTERFWYSGVTQRNKDVFLWLQNQREETAIYEACVIDRVA